LARSHIPAFGLMQIVPKSAGRDASRLVFGEERLLKGRDLFEPATNIEMGAAYLHILDRRYLKGITDAESRQMCVIAAYNTGAGNVARAFSGTTSVKKALPFINRLSSKQVYAHLRSNLKYEEARNYIQKVTKTLPLYH
jgi:membrane-bound lytic murein transglycosylase C